MPLALALGLLSAVLNFIPNLGPLLAGLPAALLAFLEGPTTALYVLIFYVTYQTLDGYGLTPLVQKQTVALPPALRAPVVAHNIMAFFPWPSVRGFDLHGSDR